MVAKYFSSKRYEFGRAQVGKFNAARWTFWDPEGKDRLLAHAVFHDITVKRSGGKEFQVKKGSLKNLLFSTLPFHPGIPSQLKSGMRYGRTCNTSEGLNPKELGIGGVFLVT
ncbi:MAG: hypothetical protein M1840_005746 [Geoglossum simile]|nr:MAG: hypothetical protein M1840_005746 [Geoglossum simile]